MGLGFGTALGIVVVLAVTAVLLGQARGSERTRRPVTPRTAKAPAPLKIPAAQVDALGRPLELTDAYGRPVSVPGPRRAAEERVPDPQV